MSRPTRRNPLLTRLLPDAVALALLLVCMGYWWLGNLAHEVTGTAFLLLVGRHVILNRRWFGMIGRGRYDAARLVRLGLNLLIAITMLILLATSVMISETLRGILKLPGIFTLREIHWLAAYWLVVIVGLHIGLHWHIVLAMARTRLPFLQTRVIAGAGWGFAILVAGLGLNSSFVMGLGTRLGFDYSLTMWDFSESTLPYFGHWLAITTLYAVLAHTAVRLLARHRSRFPIPKETVHDR
ncbi:DUF4405 domain-containing protein [Paracoccus sp. PAR01]|uniref:DUF4405 domain-containing protein n=1 Tax=Paracoccus sp. PAR01 TaxID=2769282 RepID=UPI00177DAED2|nr:DUF4405 domain-containing protein [Paracoccus sp. PAR01]MBD9528915.1 DUF4405 domain-containing protein [Paracoccus sp. PAR01]